MGCVPASDPKLLSLSHSDTTSAFTLWTHDLQTTLGPQGTELFGSEPETEVEEWKGAERARTDTGAKGIPVSV